MSTVRAETLLAAEKIITEDTVRAGFIGLFFFVTLFVATYFLWKSMNTQLRRVDAHFEADEPEETPRTRDALSAQELIAERQAALGRRGREEAAERQAGDAPAD